MSLSDRLYHLIEHCYEATSRADGWSHFAAELTRALSATHCAAIVLGGSGSSQAVLWSHGGAQPPSGDWLPHGFDPQPSHSPENRLRSETTTDGRFLTGLISRRSGRQCLVAAVNPAHAPDFSGDDKALLGELLPHIGRALQVCRAIRNCENRHGALTEVLDRLPEAVLLVDGLGNVSQAISPPGPSRDKMMASR